MNKIALTWILLCYSLLVPSEIGYPGVLSYPFDAIKLKGKIKFLSINAYEMSKDSIGNQFPTLADKSFFITHPLGNTIISTIAPRPNSGKNSEYICHFDTKMRLIEMSVWDNFAVNDGGSAGISSALSSTKHEYDKMGRETAT